MDSELCLTPSSLMLPFLLPEMLAIMVCAGFWNPVLIASKKDDPPPVGNRRLSSTSVAFLALAPIASWSETVTLYDGFAGSPSAGAEPPGGSIGMRRMTARSSHMNLLRLVERRSSLEKFDCLTLDVHILRGGN